MPVGTGLNQVPTQIREVTSLNPLGAGSLHEALTTNPNGASVMIDFDVEGVINRVGQNEINIDYPGIVVAGESAPGAGITVIGAGIRMKNSAQELRNFRILAGDVPGTPNPDNRDCIGIEGAGAPVEDIVVRGMTLGYGVDGLLDIWGIRGKRISILDNIFAEPLKNSIHPLGSHGTALLIATGVDTLVARNFFAHCDFRIPAIRGPSNVAMVNNYTYNPGAGGWELYQGDDAPGGPQAGGDIKLAMIGNVTQIGRNSPWYRTDPPGKYDILQNGMSAFTGSRVYYSDNLTTWHNDFIVGNAGLTPPIDGHAMVADFNAYPTTNARIVALGYALITATNPITLPAGLVPLAAAAVKAAILAGAGPRDKDGNVRRSLLETRLVAEATDGRIGVAKNTVPAAEAAFFGFPVAAPTYGDINDAPILAEIKAAGEAAYPTNSVTDTTLTPDAAYTAIVAALTPLQGKGAGQPLVAVDAVRAALVSALGKGEAALESLDRQRANNSKPFWQG